MSTRMEVALQSGKKRHLLEEQDMIDVFDALDLWLIEMEWQRYESDETMARHARMVKLFNVIAAKLGVAGFDRE